MQAGTSTTIRAFAALVLLAVLWGYNWVVMKHALDYAGAFQFGAMRTFYGAICLFALLLLLRKPLRPREIPTLVTLGILQTCGFTGLIIWALVEGGAGKTAVLTYTMPFWVMLLAWPLLGEKIRGIQWLAVVFSVTGLLFILDPLHLGADQFSMMLAILAGVFWAISVIVAKRLHQRVPDMDLMSLTAWQMLFGSLPLVVVAFLVPAPPIQWTGNFIGAVLFNAVLCNALAWLLWLYALQHLPAGIASMTSLLAPVIGVLAAWLQLGENPSTGEVIGMILIGVSLLIISLHSMRRKVPVDPAMGQD
ncbi:DMT family transporter [Methylobacillus gramineus]|uniref:DMT family transporter n=1 Tax=Methylobacillus gramineus TaxID=755169 RepID=UPI001CFF9395|nr:DMT family transporter [Methylobacillus gramineus]MCB5186089.1 DMT family transporter [Methylobacillus gramineus]